MKATYRQLFRLGEVEGIYTKYTIPVLMKRRTQRLTNTKHEVSHETSNDLCVVGGRKSFKNYTKDILMRYKKDEKIFTLLGKNVLFDF